MVITRALDSCYEPLGLDEYGRYRVFNQIQEMGGRGSGREIRRDMPLVG